MATGVIVCIAIGALCGPFLAALISQAPHGRVAISWSAAYGRGASLAARGWVSFGSCIALGPLGLLPGALIPVAIVVVLASVVLVVIDVRLHRLPDVVVLPAVALTVVVGVATAFGYGDRARLLPMLLTGAGLFVVFYLLALAAPSALGFGDVKLAALVGLAVGQIAPSLLLVWGVLLAPAAMVSIIVERLVVQGRPTPGPKTRGLETRGLKARVAFGPVMLGAVWFLYLLVALRT